MAQPETAAGEVGNPADSNPADAFNDIAAEMLPEGQDEEPEEEVEGDEPEAAEEAEDELEIEEEADDLPPIEAPVSWDAEAKAKFAELPRDLQETVTKREAERERFVQMKSQEVVRKEQEITQAAHTQLAQIERSYAEQFQQMAAQIIPQAPSPALLQHDPVAFYTQREAYENALAQQQQLQHQAAQYASQAQAREAQAEQAFMAEQHRIIVENLPEYADPTTGPELQRKLTAAAKRIGYSDELISQARADDIIAMKKVADALEKADRYDALQAKKMEKVRAAKGLPKVAKPGVAQGSDQLRANRAQAAWETVKTAKSRNVRDEAAATWLESNGFI